MEIIVADLELALFMYFTVLLRPCWFVFHEDGRGQPECNLEGPMVQHIIDLSSWMRQVPCYFQNLRCIDSTWSHRCEFKEFFVLTVIVGFVVVHRHFGLKVSCLLI